MVATLGLDLSNTSTRLEDQTLSETNTRQNRDSVSGVSQDEELANMLRFQRSYQACARFTNAIDSLLDLVVNKLGSF
jgi:flagellar hook-associated protein 1 FlgK